MQQKYALDLHEIARNNPKVDLVQLRESQRVQQELERAGHVRPSYDLAAPFERVRRPAVDQENRNVHDPTIFG